MALQLGATRAALLEAGASSDAADKASEELAQHETRFSVLEGDIKVIKWMIGAQIALMLAGFGVVFRLLLH